MDRRVVPYQVKCRAFGNKDVSMHQDLPVKGADIARPSRPPQMLMNFIHFFDPQVFAKIGLYGAIGIDNGTPRDKHTRL